MVDGISGEISLRNETVEELASLFVIMHTGAKSSQPSDQILMQEYYSIMLKSDFLKTNLCGCFILNVRMRNTNLFFVLAWKSSLRVAICKNAICVTNTMLRFIRHILRIYLAGNNFQLWWMTYQDVCSHKWCLEYLNQYLKLEFILNM